MGAGQLCGGGVLHNNNDDTDMTRRVSVPRKSKQGDSLPPSRTPPEGGG